MFRTFLILFTFLLSIELQAEVVMKMKNTKNENEKTTTLTLSEDFMRIDQSNENEVLFNGKTNSFLIINHAKKTIFELDEKKMHEMKEKMSGAMNMMEAQMKKMSPEQRKMMQQMMPKGINLGGNPSAKASPEADYQKTNQTQKINDWNAEQYVKMENGKKTNEVWIASLSQLGLGEKEFTIFKKLGNLTQEFAKNLPFQIPTDSKKSTFGKGFPVRTIHYEGDQVKSQFDLISITKEKVAANFFSVPVGYEKK